MIISTVRHALMLIVSNSYISALDHTRKLKFSTYVYSHFSILSRLGDFVTLAHSGDCLSFRLFMETSLASSDTNR